VQHCAAAGAAIIRSNSCTATRTITQATNLLVVVVFFLLIRAAERPPEAIYLYVSSWPVDGRRYNTYICQVRRHVENTKSKHAVSVEAG
jgi:hypothetical protein